MWASSATVCAATGTILRTILGQRYKLWISSLIVEVSPIPIRIPLGSKYSPQGPVSNTLSQRSSLNVRDYVSQRYNTTGSIIVLYILIFKFLERSREHIKVLSNIFLKYTRN
jgi:hypothetical protein